MTEKVFPVTDFYDGPVKGIANFKGKPHAFQLIFNVERDDFERTDDGFGSFRLKAVDDETLKLALESWEIWLGWQRSFQMGQTTLETHPALLEDRARHLNLEKILEERLTVDSSASIAKGRFTKSHGQWKVEWVTT